MSAGTVEAVMIAKLSKRRTTTASVVYGGVFVLVLGRKTEEEENKKLEGCFGRWMLIEAVTQQPSWVSFVQCLVSKS
jgi:hypothetical protein